MPKYEVVVIRTDRLAFEVEAEDTDAAYEKYWTGGLVDETTTDIEIRSVTEMKED